MGSDCIVDFHENVMRMMRPRNGKLEPRLRLLLSLARDSGIPNEREKMGKTLENSPCYDSERGGVYCLL